MHERALRSLEFDRIVEAVQSFALTPLGTARLASLRPLADPKGVQQALDATTESVRYLDANGPIALQAPLDLEQSLTRLAIEGQPLEALALRGIADFLASVAAVHRAVDQAAGAPFPAMRAILDACRPFDTEVGAIRKAIEPDGTVADDASEELARIRDRLQRQRARLRRTLDSYLRGRDTARYLQEQIVTERGGRYVLVVKAEHRGTIPGIVHGSSGSGASLFLEPLSTVDTNNEIVALEEQEAAEVRRILLRLADSLRSRALDLRQTLTAATEIDALQARGAFSRLVGGTAPEIATDARIDLACARHPLLIPEVRARLGEPIASPPVAPVPVDIQLVPPTSALVVTGPNAGGKTVALKTAGLLVLMAQAGLHVSADERSTTGVFRSVFADIGDEQSISASLSTFSGHITNIVTMDRLLRLPALVLLDEIGAGTDPAEGGALGAAIVDHFRERGALVIATTHDDMLKTYASTTEGVGCAGFGFDPESFAPNFRLVYGSPGRSLAFEIAARLGIAPAVIESARTRQTEREARLAEHLAKVDEDLEALEAERRQLELERAQLEADRGRLEKDRQAVREREDRLRQRLGRGVDDAVRSAGAAIEEILTRLRSRAAELERRTAEGGLGPSTGDVGALKTEARRAIETVARSVGDGEASGEVSSDTGSAATEPAIAPTVGAHVMIGSLGVRGQVLAIHEHQVEVNVRGKRLRVAVADLHAVPNPAPAARQPQVTVNVEAEAGPEGDLNVIGCTVDDAVARTEKRLDQAILHEQRVLRVIHGHGTGQLRRAIAALLERHPHVARFAMAEREHGGDGVTVVELKD